MIKSSDTRSANKLVVTFYFKSSALITNVINTKHFVDIKLNHSCTFSKLQCCFPTHSQAEVSSLGHSNVSADLSCLPEDRPLRDVTVSDGAPVKWEQRLEAVDEPWQGEDHQQQEHDRPPESHDGGWWSWTKRINLDANLSLLSRLWSPFINSCLHRLTRLVLPQPAPKYNWTGVGGFW